MYHIHTRQTCIAVCAAVVFYTIHTVFASARLCNIQYMHIAHVLRACVCAIWAAEGGCLEICTLSSAGGFNAPTIATNTFEYILSVHNMGSCQFKLIFSINISVRKMPEGEKGLIFGLVYKV